MKILILIAHICQKVFLSLMLHHLHVTSLLGMTTSKKILTLCLSSLLHIVTDDGPLNVFAPNKRGYMRTFVAFYDSCWKTIGEVSTSCHCMRCPLETYLTILHPNLNPFAILSSHSSMDCDVNLFLDNHPKQ